MPTGAELLAELDERGLVHDCTSRDALAARLDEGPTVLYCGFDPTADSLHLGNLQSIMPLRRYQRRAPADRPRGRGDRHDRRSVGRDEERQFLDAEVLDANRDAIAAQLRGLLDFEPGPASAKLVDNRTWTEPMGVLEFLRDVGKHVTVNTMLARESVKNRMDRESGISYTEFSYMLLQAHDFLVLHRDHGCDLQVAGSDQWGNIAAGVDLIRRRTGDTVHGMTAPLIVRQDGTKFGKSQGENIWLSPERTSPYRLYQYLLNVPDADVGTLLLRLTTVPVEECRAVAAEHAEHPERRDGQRRLARELTALVHGAAVIDPIERASTVLFGGDRTRSARTPGGCSPRAGGDRGARGGARGHRPRGAVHPLGAGPVQGGGAPQPRGLPRQPGPPGGPSRRARPPARCRGAPAGQVRPAAPGQVPPPGGRGLSGRRQRGSDVTGVSRIPS